MDRRIGGYGAMLILGLGVGWGLTRTGATIRADGPDRVEGSVLVSGKIGMQMHPTLKIQVPQDAVYYLDYAKGRLSAAVPSYMQVGSQARVLGEFSSRDLASDFRLPPGTTPHFAMTIADLGASNSTSAVFVVESATRRIASYWCESRGAGPSGDLPPRLDLVEIKDLP